MHEEDTPYESQRTPLLTVRGEGAGQVDEEALAVAVSATGSRPLNALDNHKLPFRWRPLVAISLTKLVQPLCFELIFPFINQMVVENGIVGDPEQVGFYSGFIESIFQVMSFLTVLPCSFVSDHYGRKKVILTGTLGMSLSVSLFGMSKTYWMMIATRCIGGMLGGTSSAIKVMMGEIYTSKAHRATAFSTVQIAFRLGQIAGQPLGGLLSHPARNLKVFDAPFWRTYPFSLPCFVAASVSLSIAAWAFFALKETLPPSLRRRGLSERGDDESTAGMKRPTLMSALTPHVISVLTSTLIMTLVSETIYALYPLFAFTPISSGGLGFSEAQIGMHLAVRSALNIVVLFAYAPLCNWLGGAVRCYRVGMALWPLVMACLPLLNALARTGPERMGVGTWAFDSMVLAFFMLWSLGCLVWPSSSIVIIEAPSNPESLAVGLGQMVINLMMGLAPALVTNLFAFSIKSQILGGNLVYVVMLSLGVFGAVHSLTLKEAIH